MDVFEKAYEFAARWEGGLDDDPDDPGGITHYGVSINALKDLYRRNASFLGSIGILGPITRQTIIDLTPEQAKKIFKREYWPAGFETLAETHPRMAFAAFDTALNMGESYARKLVQTAVSSNQEHTCQRQKHPQKLPFIRHPPFTISIIQHNHSRIKILQHCGRSRIAKFNTIIKTQLTPQHTKKR